MTKIRPVANQPKQDAPVLPVLVRVRVVPAAAGVPVEIRLVFPAAWHGIILPQLQIVMTDESGVAEVRLPPTDEMTWLVPAPPSLKPFFQVVIPGYGTFPVYVPSGVDTYTIGE
jgi:hypothetical protein